MDPLIVVDKTLGRLPPRVVRVIERGLRRIPAVRRRLEQEYDAMLADVAPSVKPYRETFPTFDRLPETGRARDEIVAWSRALQAEEEASWRDGYVSLAVFAGDEAHTAFLNEVMGLHAQSNPLHVDLWPSAAKFESEIVAMTAGIVGGGADDIVGTVTSGGTESILMAMKTYRDWARAEKGIRRPEMVMPVTAHAAFYKAAHYFDIKPVIVPVGPDYRADMDAVRRAVGRRTICVVGSAPTYPHGVIDPIDELAALARERGIGCHVDACLGGFVLPFAAELGYAIPPWDFGLPGVTSMSADTHKYGYAAKGSSVVLYRGRDLRRFQYFTVADWAGGMYFSPTMAGSRPGALSAACWASLVAFGRDGYRDATRRILDTGAALKAVIGRFPELHILGDPLWVIAFGSDSMDIYQLMEQMRQRGWSLNGLHKPAALNLGVTLRHTQPGVVERFEADLAASIRHVRAHPDEATGMAPVYGLAASIPLRGVVDDVLRRYIDMVYEV